MIQFNFSVREHKIVDGLLEDPGGGVLRLFAHSRPESFGQETIKGKLINRSNTANCERKKEKKDKKKERKKKKEKEYGNAKELARVSL